MFENVNSHARKRIISFFANFLGGKQNVFDSKKLKTSDNLVTFQKTSVSGGGKTFLETG